VVHRCSEAILTGSVLGSHARLFKDVFNRANTELMDVFGMQMVELPKAERVTMRQKRGKPLRYLTPILSNFSSRGRVRIAK
jgi:hypothetical protein